MEKEAELSMKLAKSFLIQEVIGDWKNNANFKLDGEKKSHSYTILILADYQHLLFHIGIAIKELNFDLSIEKNNIMKKTEDLVKEIQKAKLNNEKLHFTGKIFVMTSEAKYDIEKLKQKFAENNLSLTVYEEEENNLKIVSKKLNVSSSYDYDSEVMDGEKEAVYSSANYTIWESNNGEITYAFNMFFNSEGLTNEDVHRSLSELSPYREKVDKLLYNKKLKKEYSRVFASAIKDTFEGKLEAAKQTLIEAEKNIKEKLLIQNVAITGGFCLISLLVIFLFINFIVKNGSDFHMGALTSFWGGFGAFISMLTPIKSLESTLGYTPFELIVETAVRLFVGLVSGLLLYFAIKSNIVLGILENTSNKYIIFLLAISAGWSERFLSRFLSTIKEQLNIE